MHLYPHCISILSSFPQLNPVFLEKNTHTISLPEAKNLHGASIANGHHFHPCFAGKIVVNPQFSLVKLW